MGSGGADIVGVRNASKPVKKRATRRLEALDVPDGEQPVGRRDLLAGLPQRPVQRLDLVLARLAGRGAGSSTA
jgi:hypothetical protein